MRYHILGIPDCREFGKYSSPCSVCIRGWAGRTHQGSGVTWTQLGQLQRIPCQPAPPAKQPTPTAKPARQPTQPLRLKAAGVIRSILESLWNLCQLTQPARQPTQPASEPASQPDQPARPPSLWNSCVPLSDSCGILARSLWDLGGTPTG